MSYNCWQQPYYENCDSNNSNTFVLIVVLFILLVIIGAICVK